jgi:hypothetical protein
MPISTRGIVPDLILNPHSIPSRMTVGDLLELIGGKAASLNGEIVDGTAFSGTPLEYYRKILMARGFRPDGYDIFYDGISGRPIMGEIFVGVTDCSKLLTKEHQKSVQKMLSRINNPDLTPSAMILEEMRQTESGFFEYIDKLSHQNRELYRSKSIDKDYFDALEELAISSHQEQLKMEAKDVLSFDEFIEEYFAVDG